MTIFENPQRVNIEEAQRKYLDQFILIADTKLNFETAFLLAVSPVRESIKLFEMRDAIWEQMEEHTTEYTTVSVLKCKSSKNKIEIEDIEY